MLDVTLTDATHAMQQSILTAADYLLGAVTHIDRELGRDYARKNPALIAAFMNVCAQDFAATLQKAAAQDMRDAEMGR